EPEVARVALGWVVAEHVPALSPVDQRVRLDRALGELVLVLLVVLDRQQARVDDRAVDRARHLLVVTDRRSDLEAVMRWVLTQRADDLVARRCEAPLG